MARLPPNVDEPRLLLYMAEARRDLAADGFSRGYEARAIYGPDRETIIGALVIGRNEAGEEAHERVIYPLLGEKVMTDQEPPKPLLVGELNPFGADPYYALYPLPSGSSGGRLARLLGLSMTAYLRRFDRANLCTGSWSAPAARAAAAELRRREGKIVLLGAKVRGAFGLDLEPFSVQDRFVVIPHPSGLNRAWGEPGARDRLRRLFAEQGLPVGEGGAG